MAQPQIEIDQITTAPIFDGTNISNVDAITVSGETTATLHDAGNLTGIISAINGSQITNITKSQVGLSNVNNTSDLSKPISTATQTALNGKGTVDPNNYATNTVGGTVKARVSGTTAYFTINGNNA